ncbi:MAG: hypothetical protein IKU81_06220 [Oscillibacter sp.]|nr:hypothetical protein [Oscillibacter sp.]
MLTIFNRRELITVLSTQQLYGIQSALTEAEIPFHAAVLNQGGPFRSRGQANPFMKVDNLNQYRIYVHKNDYDRAMAAIQNVLRG